MKKAFLLFLFIFSMNSHAQKTDFWNDVQYGGGFTLGFGNNQTTVGISPSAVYNFNNGFSLGTGVTYIYSKFEDSKTNVYGASIISLYQIPKINIQLSGEYEHSFAKQTVGASSFNSDFPALYFGAAYNKGKFAFGFRYDVLYDENKSVYASAFSPIVRFYF